MGLFFSSVAAGFAGGLGDIASTALQAHYGRQAARANRNWQERSRVRPINVRLLICALLG